ncbi:hypothetical protein [Roseibacillus persicicus]|uniref:hypothetical protein n=1 Tax=Roseibacillus persicicus TaxID=454148 RepID=UPI0028121472|nr:hypothetical protein [Roseibacillus persicicus]
MRIFSIIVAILSLGAGLGCLAMVSKYRKIYMDLELTLPTFNQTLLKTSGLMPGGFFIAFAVLLLTLICCKQTKSAFYLAIPTLFFIILVSITLPIALISPLSTAKEPENRNRTNTVESRQPDEEPSE